MAKKTERPRKALNIPAAVKPDPIAEPIAEPSAPAPVDADRPRVLVEDDHGAVIERVVDPGEDDRTFRVRIGGVIHDHCSEHTDGRWIYRKG
jgi:hypothetical protein